MDGIQRMDAIQQFFATKLMHMQPSVSNGFYNLRDDTVKWIQNHLPTKALVRFFDQELYLSQCKLNDRAKSDLVSQVVSDIIQSHVKRKTINTVDNLVYMFTASTEGAEFQFDFDFGDVKQEKCTITTDAVQRVAQALPKLMQRYKNLCEEMYTSFLRSGSFNVNTIAQDGMHLETPLNVSRSHEFCKERFVTLIPTLHQLVINTVRDNNYQGEEGFNAALRTLRIDNILPHWEQIFDDNQHTHSSSTSMLSPSIHGGDTDIGKTVRELQEAIEKSKSKTERLQEMQKKLRDTVQEALRTLST